MEARRVQVIADAVASEARSKPQLEHGGKTMVNGAARFGMAGAIRTTSAR
jgi:hypothetical protein